jgi:hypothetical protein
MATVVKRYLERSKKTLPTSFATAANLLIEIVGGRKTQIKENRQQQLKLAA